MHRLFIEHLNHVSSDPLVLVYDEVRSVVGILEVGAAMLLADCAPRQLCAAA